MAKIRPDAEIHEAHDEDGRNFWKEVRYRCPKCRKIISEEQIGCEECEIFFDWSEKAKIRTIRIIYWE